MRPLPATVFRQATQNDKIAFAANVMLIVALACGFLYLGREILVPVALAVLFTFLLTPSVKWLQRRHLPKALAISTIVIVVFGLLAGVGFLVSRQITALSGELPKYESNLRAKIKNVREMSNGGGMLGGAGDLLGRLGAELDAKPAAGPESGNETPNAIAVVKTDPGMLESYGLIVTPLLYPAVQSVLVVIFCIFFLFQREDLRDRVIRLAGRGDLLKTTAALDEAATKLSRLFLMQAVVNTGFGLFIGVCLWMLAIPAAALWGVFAGLMRFVPYIGAVLSAVFPVLLAAAISPDWTLPLMVITLFLIAEPVVGHAIEPLVFGHTAGLSPVAVITAAAFWTALWGPVGLLLATPLTICLAVVGRHVEGLGFLDVLFGSQPPLTPSQTFYQRLLARDRLDAVAISEKWLSQASMAEFLKDVALPALMIAEGDRTQNRLTSHDQTALASEFSAVLEDIFVIDGDVEGSTEDMSILLLAAPGALNFSAAVALSASLSAAGVAHKMLDEGASSPLAGKVDSTQATIALVLVYLVDPPAERVEFMRRRLKSRYGTLPMIVAGWFAAADEDGAARLHAGVADLLITRLQQAQTETREAGKASNGDHSDATAVTNSA